MGSEMFWLFDSLLKEYLKKVVYITAPIYYTHLRTLPKRSAQLNEKFEAKRALSQK